MFIKYYLPLRLCLRLLSDFKRNNNNNNNNNISTTACLELMVSIADFYEFNSKSFIPFLHGTNLIALSFCWQYLTFSGGKKHMKTTNQ